METLGPPGTFGHEAARIASDRLRPSYGEIELKWRGLNQEIPTEAEYNRRLGVVPIHNSDRGLVPAVIEFWKQRREGFRSHVIGEVTLRVEHQLWVHPSITRKKQLQAVMSHPHALGQCSIALNALGVRGRLEASSTAEAARLVQRGGKHRRVAAIASRLAGETYQLKLWKANIHNHSGNYTRFHILGPKPSAPTGLDRTAVIVFWAGKTGQFISRFQSVDFEGVAVHLFESVGQFNAPDSETYIEFDTHRDSDKGREILRQLQRVGKVVVLGSFPMSTE